MKSLARPAPSGAGLASRFSGKFSAIGGSASGTTSRFEFSNDVVVKPSVQTVAKIAKALGVPMEELVK